MIQEVALCRFVGKPTSNLHKSGVIVADEGVIRGVLNVTITSAKVSFSVFRAVETKCFDR